MISIVTLPKTSAHNSLDQALKFHGHEPSPPAAPHHFYIDSLHKR